MLDEDDGDYTERSRIKKQSPIASYKASTIALVPTTPTTTSKTTLSRRTSAAGVRSAAAAVAAAAAAAASATTKDDEKENSSAQRPTFVGVPLSKLTAASSAATLKKPIPVKREPLKGGNYECLLLSMHIKNIFFFFFF